MASLQGGLWRHLLEDAGRQLDGCAMAVPAVTANLADGIWSMQLDPESPKHTVTAHDPQEVSLPFRRRGRVLCHSRSDGGTRYATTLQGFQKVGKKRDALAMDG